MIIKGATSFSYKPELGKNSSKKVTPKLKRRKLSKKFIVLIGGMLLEPGYIDVCLFAQFAWDEFTKVKRKWICQSSRSILWPLSETRSTLASLPRIYLEEHVTPKWPKPSLRQSFPRSKLRSEASRFDSNHIKVCIVNHERPCIRWLDSLSTQPTRSAQEVVVSKRGSHSIYRWVLDIRGCIARLWHCTNRILSPRKQSDEMCVYFLL